jgi:catechol 2,3-dioxygenase-like lactoylglutathione lyase family enzyme
MKLNVLQKPIKFHVSINVSSLDRSIDFYRILFGLEPAKRHGDYCKFELEDPPVAFSLVPSPPSSGVALSSFGFRVPEEAAIYRIQERLNAAGIATTFQECTMCGYAKQKKCWVADPDGNHWGVYWIEEDVDPRLTRQALEGVEAVAPPQPARHVWEHFITHPTPEGIPHADNSLDEVRLVATFNSAMSDDDRRRILTEAYRALRPGGKLLVRGMAADAEFPNGTPKLNNVAIEMPPMPKYTEPQQAVEQAGFRGAEFVHFNGPPDMEYDGVGMRQMRLVAWKPDTESNRLRHVLYKGPFREVCEAGQVYPRGERIPTDDATWNLLRKGKAATQFLFLDPDMDAEIAACSSNEPQTCSAAR